MLFIEILHVRSKIFFQERRIYCVFFHSFALIDCFCNLGFAKLNKYNAMKRFFALCVMASAVCCVAVAAEVRWFDGSRAVSYYVEGKSAPVVGVALEMFSCDMDMVTGQKAVSDKGGMIRIYELDKNGGAVGRLRKLGVPAEEVRDRMDAFWIGVRQGRILVVGNNGRGCAYGILELSRLAGVSPWVWWGDVVPQRRDVLVMDEAFETLQSPSVAFRGIFINDEDWSLRNWAWKTFEGGKVPGMIGPKTYKELFKLMLRLRANVIWPAMHEGTAGFFTVKGNKEVADECGMMIGTSHCEPLLRNNVAEWNVRERGAYNYITNKAEVQKYWTERLKEVAGSEELFTIGMRGIHDGSMEGVSTKQEKLEGLQMVIDDQRDMLAKYINKDVTKVPQVFIPYKEVLEIMESGLRVPDDVTLMWCDDNYGYMTRLSDAEQQKRSGGGGVYYHLSYWGRPHDYLWLTTTQPGLIYSEMKTAYDHNARRLWIVNVHDPKVAAYDLELFLDMAWNIDAVQPQGICRHLEQWLCTQFGTEVGRHVAPAMQELCRLNAVRRPEFMGWTQVELDKRKYPGGKSVPTTTELTMQEACRRLADFGAVKATVDAYARMVPQRLRDAYFAMVQYPVHASAAMSRKMLSPARESREAYEEIQSLTERYNALAGGKWNGLMSAAPRELPVFGDVRTELAETSADEACGQRIVRNACEYSSATGGIQAIQMLGHSMNAVCLPKGEELVYDFETEKEGDAVLYTAMIPTQPNDKGDLRYSVQLDDAEPVVISLKEKYRSEFWKKSVMRGQALKQNCVKVKTGRHTLRIKALDDHIIADQWMLDFAKDRSFYSLF